MNDVGIGKFEVDQVNKQAQGTMQALLKDVEDRAHFVIKMAQSARSECQNIINQMEGLLDALGDRK